MKTVGILGGMGPEATVALMSRVIAAVPARDDADHVPLLVDQNTQVPSRIAALIDGVGADPGPVLAGMAQRLQVAGAQALAMPCNTAHHYAPLIRSAATVPFLDMVGLSVVRVAALGVGTMGLLGSPALRRVGVYDAACANAGLQVVYLTDEDAALALIRQIKAQGPTGPARARLQQLAAGLGTDAVLIACTEFSLMAGAVQATHVIDTLDVLARAIIAFSTGESRG
jgi:aspartate racemase